MKIKKKKLFSQGIKFFVELDNIIIGRAYLYILQNDLHARPFGFIEDIFISEEYRGQGIGSTLINSMLREAKKQNCYKIIMTSRYSKPRVQKLYLELGFKDHGKEFRLDI